jgi:hypothetical protein
MIMAYIINLPISNTNTTASQTVEVIPLILLEYLNRSSWNLVCIPCHLRPSQQCTSCISPISNTNTTASHIIEVIPLILLWIPEPTVMKLGMYILPSEVISTVYLINYSHQEYQHWSLPNCDVLLTSLRIHTKVFSAYRIRYSNYCERKVGD